MFMAKDGFQERYEQALDGLTGDQIAQVVQLNPLRLHEWVDAPAKIRPFLVEKWQKEDQASGVCVAPSLLTSSITSL